MAASIEGVVDRVVGGLASARFLGRMHTPPGRGLPWDTWAIYPDHDADHRREGYQSADEAICALVAEALGAEGLTVELLHRGSTPWVLVHDADLGEVARHRGVQP